ncbi:MAG: ACT domain-containing protein [Christensenellales bacterium]
MFVKQISVFIENKRGRLAALTRQLGENQLDLVALSIADTTNFGILRCIVNDTEKALRVIRDAGFTANTTDVMATEVHDKPGGLAKVLALLDEAGINVEYLYSFVRTPSDKALILFRVDDIGRAVKLLKENDIHTLSHQEVCSL